MILRIALNSIANTEWGAEQGLTRQFLLSASIQTGGRLSAGSSEQALAG